MSTEKGVKLDSGKNRLGLVLGGFFSRTMARRLRWYFWC